MGMRVAAVLFSAIQGAQALNNGLGRRPGLGWNSDYCTNCSGPVPQHLQEYGSGLRARSAAQGHGGEAFVKHIADHMHTVKYKATAGAKTLQELGFHYVNMDASWDLPNRSSGGDLAPDPKLWPSGLDHTVSYVHSLGLGFGLYGDRGTMDCARDPGQFGHEANDGAWLGAHKIDWFKSDACYATDRSIKNKTAGEAVAIALYRKMGSAMNTSGYPIWYALCGWSPWYAPVGQGLANSARIGPDTGGGWTAVLQNLENALPMSHYAGPSAEGGYWNDGSLQLTPGMGCKSGGGSMDSAAPADDCMTNARFVSMYSIWTVMAFNLLLVGDFAKLNPFVMATWSNDRVLAIDQDELGVAAVRVDGVNASGPPPAGGWGASLSGASQMAVAECGGEPAEQKWVLDSPSAGYVENAATATCLDVGSCQTWITYGPCNATGGCGQGMGHKWAFTAAGQLQTKLASPTKCATMQDDKTVILAACTTPVPATQKFGYDKATQQLTTGGGLCVTADPGDLPGGTKIKAETIVLGRPLSSPPPGGNATVATLLAAGRRSYALLFLNNLQKAASVACGAACLARLGASGSFSVTDVITGKPHAAAELDVATGSISATVEGYGHSVYLRLDPK